MTGIERKTGMTDAGCGRRDDYYAKNTFAKETQRAPHKPRQSM
jgi:hypothetical protein